MPSKDSIQEIKRKLANVEHLEDPFFQSLTRDERKGVITLKAACEKRIIKQNNEKVKFKQRTQNENRLYSEGYEVIAGIDEVGRGPLAGPVVAASVILPKDFFCLGIRDSKKIPEFERESLYQIIVNNSIDYAVGIVNEKEIDSINIYEATKKAMNTSITNLKYKPDYLLIDAMKLSTTIPQLSIVHGDDLSISIAAASIIAKVTRDNLMREYDKRYPEYNFKSNKGYGTKEHIQAILKYGVSPIHRLSFAPIKNM